MPKKKKTTPRSTVRVRSSRRTRGTSSGADLLKFVIPAAILLLLIAGITFMSLSGYQTATASAFFNLKNVDVRGIDRTPKDDIVRVVNSSIEKSGVWNADLADVKLKLEKFPFVKTASVSRALPTGIRVNIVERVPVAIVKLSSGNYLVDGEGVPLIQVKGNDKEFPFILQGWDESKSEKSGPDNLARLKVYKKMVDEAKQFEVAGRVKEISLANPRQPVAVVEDSGKLISVSLARDSLGKSLKTAIDALTGKGAKIKSVDAGGVHPIIQYLEF
jgi:hypothetical protein